MKNKGSPRHKSGPSGTGAPVRCALTALVDPASLRPNPQNPKRHSKRKLALYAKIMSLETLTERFQTRFRMVRVEPPGEIALAAWLARRWKVPEKRAQFIALGACGNVRSALLDAADFHTFGKIEHRPKLPEIVKDPAASARALKAWDTMRSRNAA